MHSGSQSPHALVQSARSPVAASISGKTQVTTKSFTPASGGGASGSGPHPASRTEAQSGPRKSIDRILPPKSLLHCSRGRAVCDADAGAHDPCAQRSRLAPAVDEGGALVGRGRDLDRDRRGGGGDLHVRE